MVSCPSPSLGHGGSGPGTQTCVRGRDGKLCRQPQKRIGLCLHLRMHLSSQTLDKHCHSPSKPLCGLSPREQGRRGVQAERSKPHSVHSCLLTAPGTTVVSPRCPEIPADSSVGELGQHEGTGRVSRDSASANVPNSERKEAERQGGGAVATARILPIPA